MNVKVDEYVIIIMMMMIVALLFVVEKKPYYIMISVFSCTFFNLNCNKNILLRMSRMRSSSFPDSPAIFFLLGLR